VGHLACCWCGYLDFLLVKFDGWLNSLDTTFLIGVGYEFHIMMKTLALIDDWLIICAWTRHYSRHLPLGRARLMTWLIYWLIVLGWALQQTSPSWWGLTQDFTRLDLIDYVLPLGGAGLKTLQGLIWLTMISLLVGLDSRLQCLIDSMEHLN